MIQKVGLLNNYYTNKTTQDMILKYLKYVELEEIHTLNPSGIEPELYPSQGYVLSIERWILTTSIYNFKIWNYIINRYQKLKSQTTFFIIKDFIWLLSSLIVNLYRLWTLYPGWYQLSSYSSSIALIFPFLSAIILSEILPGTFSYAANFIL